MALCFLYWAVEVKRTGDRTVPYGTPVSGTHFCRWMYTSLTATKSVRYSIIQEIMGVSTRLFLLSLLSCFRVSILWLTFHTVVLIFDHLLDIINIINLPVLNEWFNDQFYPRIALNISLQFYCCILSITSFSPLGLFLYWVEDNKGHW